MTQYYFSIFVSYREFLKVYRGQVSSIVVYEEGGLRVQIPAMRFLPFVTAAGIEGRFRLTLDNNKFVELIKI
ncbi:DUF2835 family protein [Alginatibacterium sediminis]|uniref:DUF2835 family protein n=1 Tax=Alginatibacterium sediminis TaxID=2164068 RepID=A0A420EHS5_9ALTE|nr:DUF2835 family protein [Alginatibacterium sediminis]RKF20204.1 DUF2835 family protein [Alginatibacterium sediminis]